jgi:hypothetical protein
MLNDSDRSPKPSSTTSDQHAEYIAHALVTEGGHLRIGRGGFTLHFGDDVRLHGYDCETIKTECIAAGLPIIDSRDAPFEKVADVAIRGPMVAVGRTADPEPYHCLSFAPLSHVADAYQSIGAEVLNLPPRP